MKSHGDVVPLEMQNARLTDRIFNSSRIQSGIYSVHLYMIQRQRGQNTSL